MPSYTIRWEINVDADNPKKAAIQCLEIHQDPFSESLYYEVTEDATNKKTMVDLLLDEVKE